MLKITGGTFLVVTAVLKMITPTTCFLVSTPVFTASPAVLRAEAGAIKEGSFIGPVNMYMFDGYMCTLLVWCVSVSVGPRPLLTSICVYVCTYGFSLRHYYLNKKGQARRHMLLGALDHHVLRSWLDTLTLIVPPFWQCLIHFTCSFDIGYKSVSFMVAYSTICSYVLFESRSLTWCRCCFGYI